MCVVACTHPETHLIRPQRFSMLAIYYSATRETRTFWKNSWYTIRCSVCSVAIRATQNRKCERHLLGDRPSNTHSHTHQPHDIHIESVAIIIISCKQYTSGSVCILQTFLTIQCHTCVLCIIASHAFEICRKWYRCLFLCAVLHHMQNDTWKFVPKSTTKLYLKWMRRTNLAAGQKWKRSIQRICRSIRNTH